MHPSVWPFNRKPTASELLLQRFLDLEGQRLNTRSDLEAKREELEVKKLEIELTHLEARTKAQIELEAAQQELRIKRREAGRKGMAKRRAMASLQSDIPLVDGVACGLCVDENTRNITVRLVQAHALHPKRSVVNETGN